MRRLRTLADKYYGAEPDKGRLRQVSLHTYSRLVSFIVQGLFFVLFFLCVAQNLTRAGCGRCVCVCVWLAGTYFLLCAVYV